MYAALHYRNGEIPNESVINSWTQTYTCFIVIVCGSVDSQCGTQTWSCQYDNYTEDISSHYSGTRK